MFATSSARKYCDICNEIYKRKQKFLHKHHLKDNRFKCCCDDCDSKKEFFKDHYHPSSTIVFHDCHINDKDDF